MMTRIAFVAAVLLSAGVARAASSSVPATEETVLETSGAAASYVACEVSPSAHVAALLQVPAEERGKVEAASCDTNVTWPTDVDARYHR